MEDDTGRFCAETFFLSSRSFEPFESVFGKSGCRLFVVSTSSAHALTVAASRYRSEGTAVVPNNTKQYLSFPTAAPEELVSPRRPGKRQRGIDFHTHVVFTTL